MNRRVIFEALIAAALLWIWWRLPSPPAAATAYQPPNRISERGQIVIALARERTTGRRQDETPPSATAINSSSSPSPLIGELILRDYASPSNSPEHDLALMSQLMGNFTLIVKSAATRPLSAN